MKVSQGIHCWLEYHKLHSKKTIKTNQSVLSKLTAQFGERELNALTQKKKGAGRINNVSRTTQLIYLNDFGPNSRVTDKNVNQCLRRLFWEQGIHLIGARTPKTSKNIHVDFPSHLW